MRKGNTGNSESSIGFSRKSFFNLRSSLILSDLRNILDVFIVIPFLVFYKIVLKKKFNIFSVGARR
jgi:hypothetical protein